MTKLIQEAKMTIWKWIKFREKYDNPFRTNLNKKQAINEAGTAQVNTQEGIKGNKQVLVEI